MGENRAKDVSAINMFASSFMRCSPSERPRVYATLRNADGLNEYVVAIIEAIERVPGHTNMDREYLLQCLSRDNEGVWFITEFVRAAGAAENCYQHRQERMREHSGNPKALVNTFRDYENEVERTAAGLSMQNLPILGLGLAGEAGEVADIFKKVFGHGHTFTPETEQKVVEEIGDLMWYCVAVLRTLGVPLQEALEQNALKLRRRYPLGFSTQASQERVDVVQKKD